MFWTCLLTSMVSLFLQNFLVTNTRAQRKEIITRRRRHPRNCRTQFFFFDSQFHSSSNCVCDVCVCVWIFIYNPLCYTHNWIWLSHRSVLWKYQQHNDNFVIFLVSYLFCCIIFLSISQDGHLHKYFYHDHYLYSKQQQLPWHVLY